MIIGREIASVEEARVEGGGLMKVLNESLTAQWKDGREEASGGGIERGRAGARGKDSQGGKKTSREVSRGGHRPVYSTFTNHSTKRPLALRPWYYK